PHVNRKNFHALRSVLIEDRRGWTLLEGQGVITYYPRAMFDQEIRSIKPRPGRIWTGIEAVVGLKVLPPAGPNEYCVALLEFHPLQLGCLFQMAASDRVRRRQRAGGPLDQPCDVLQIGRKSRANSHGCL